jgi:hypothetical protein
MILIRDAQSRGIQIVPHPDGTLQFRGTAIRHPQFVDDSASGRTWLLSNVHAKCSKCSSQRYIESVARGGRAVRRDCLKCKFFQGFSVFNLDLQPTTKAG